MQLQPGHLTIMFDGSPPSDRKCTVQEQMSPSIQVCLTEDGQRILSAQGGQTHCNGRIQFFQHSRNVCHFAGDGQ